MSVTAIIAEYNPFHNGHLYQIREARKLTGCDHIIAVMSGNFVQRGEPAIMDKFDRSFCALDAGLDAVFELPVCFSTASAESFAYGAVSLLNGLGCVDFLCFGSECGSLEILDTIADILVSQPDWYLDGLKKSLKNGLSFPAAREASLWNYLEKNPGSGNALHSAASDRNAFSVFLSMPNNILGIEYLKALKKSGSSITPVTIKRKGSHYHDLSLSPLCSASAIRSRMKPGNDIKDIKAGLPEGTLTVTKQKYNKTFPVYMEDFSPMLRYRLVNFSRWEEILSYMDISRELARRIFSLKSEYNDCLSFAAALKTKNTTLSNIQRALIHILLDIRSSDICDSGTQALFARLLGMRRGSSVLSQIKKNSHLPILTKPADAHSLLTSHYSGNDKLLSMAHRQFSDTVRSSEIYHAAICEKFHAAPYSEYRQSPIIL